MYCILFVVLLVVQYISAKGIRYVHAKSEFPNFMINFGKLYSTPEEQMYRYKVFTENVKIINDHNAKGLSYSFGVNKFTDLTQQEFIELVSLPPVKQYKRRILADFDNMVNADEVDWAAKGAVSKIKDQGACGSCYSFSVTSAIESAYFIAYGTMKYFSEQQIVDCSGSYGCQGCSGGWMADAFAYVVDHGLCTETDYPYRASEQKCKEGTCTAAVKLSKYVDVPKGEVNLAKAVTLNPVSIALDATPMQHYSKGIYTGTCQSTAFNHAVLVVGYGIESETKFWKIKNSWGSSWGENGYYRLIKDDGSSTGRCGVAAIASYPVVK